MLNCRKQKNIRLIAVDLDGCLLDSDKKLPADLTEILQKLQKRNILFAAATGRPLDSIHLLFKDIHMPFDIIADNGCLIIHEGAVILEQCFRKEEAEKILHAIYDRDDMAVVLSTKEGTLYDEKAEIMLRKLSTWSGFNMKKVNSLSEYLEHVYKFALFFPGMKDDAPVPQFLLPYRKDYEVCNTTGGWVDINLFDTNKGAAMTVLQKKLGIENAEVMAFGDSDSDVEMLMQAGRGYALLNGCDSVKKKAEFITEYDNDHCGVTRTIEKYLEEENI